MTIDQMQAALYAAFSGPSEPENVRIEPDLRITFEWLGVNFQIQENLVVTEWQDGHWRITRKAILIERLLAMAHEHVVQPVG